MIAGIIAGIGLALAAVGFVVYAQDKGWTMAWWQCHTGQAEPLDKVATRDLVVRPG